MNWKVLVNALLVVLLLHFIIKNLQYAYTSNTENFADKLPESLGTGSIIPEDTPVEGPYDKSEEPVQTVNMKKEHFNAIQFLTTPEKDYDNVFYLNRETDKVKQANVYTNDWNVANFGSNVLDVRNFFKTSPPKVDTKLAHRDLELQDDAKVGSCFSKDSLVKPDVWKYKDEFPMNGGSFLNIGSQSVYGFDDTDNTFASFDSNDPLIKSNCKSDKCEDDIRNGMGTPGRRWWSTN